MESTGWLIDSDRGSGRVWSRLRVGGVFAVLCFIIAPSAEILRAQFVTVDSSYGRDTTTREVYYLKIWPEPDGGCLAGGYFHEGGLGPFRTVAKFDAHGQWDTSWGKQLDNIRSEAWARQTDGKILIGGDSLLANDQPSFRLARVNVDGSWDASFRINGGVEGGRVQAVGIQPNGFILLAGNFLTVAGQPRIRMARVGAQGELDPTFDPGDRLSTSVHHLFLQPDGKVLVALDDDNTPSFRSLLRLNSDGSIDSSFQLGFVSFSYVRDLVTQADGKIIACGVFYVGGNARGLVRLNADGSIDGTFKPGSGPSGNEWFLSSVLAQSDGRVLVTGRFTHFSGTRADHIVRLNADGVVDRDFDPGFFEDAASAVLTAAPTPEGTLLLGGQFDRLAGVPLKGLAKLTELPEAHHRGRIQFSAPQFSVNETGKVAKIRLTRIRSTLDEAAVSFRTLPGNGFNPLGLWAEAGSDYSPVSTSVVFTNGQSSAVVDVPILDDSLVESDEMVALALEAPAPGVVLGDPSEASLVVQENETAFEIAETQSSMSGGDPLEGIGSYGVNVVRLGSLRGTATVGYTTRDGTAIAGLDYTLRSGTLSFADGQYSATATVSIRQDTLVEGTETFSFILTNSSRGTSLGARTNWVVSLLDDDDDGPGSRIPTFAPSFTRAVGFIVPRHLRVFPSGNFLLAGSISLSNDPPHTQIGKFSPTGAVLRSWDSGLPAEWQTVSVSSGPEEEVLVGGPRGTESEGGEMTEARVVRLLSDGRVDPNFELITEPGGSFFAIESLSSGAWVVAGGFTEINGLPRTGLARINPEGGVDESFNPVFEGSSAPTIINGLLASPDGTLLLQGQFESVNGVPCRGIVRLRADGQLDLGWTLDPRVPASASLAGIQPGGKVLLIVSSPHTILRLRSDGSLDNTFHSPAFTQIYSGIPATVTGVVVDSLGRLIVAGDFDGVDGSVRRAVARLDSDGHLDWAWKFLPLPGFVTAGIVALLPGDDLLVANSVYQDGKAPSALLLIRAEQEEFLGRIELQFPEITVWETNGVFALPLRRSGATVGQPASVMLSVTSGSATNGVDFLLPPTRVEFAADETQKLVPIELIQDGLIEDPEVFFVALSRPIGAILGDGIQTKTTILDHPGGMVDDTFQSSVAWPDWLKDVFQLPGGDFLALGTFHIPRGSGLVQQYVRIRPDGSFDTNYSGSLPDNASLVAIGGDGSAFISSGSDFRRPSLVRLQPDGQPDTTFSPRAIIATAMAVQPDGLLLLNEDIPMILPEEFTPPFTNRLFRLTPSGSEDVTFSPNVWISSTQALGIAVRQITLDTEGRILVGGVFGSVAGEPRLNLARLDRDGRIDPTFRPQVEGEITQLNVQVDGRILVGGSIARVNGVARHGLAQILPDGRLDESFVPASDEGARVLKLLVQGDGAILAAMNGLPGRGYLSDYLVRLSSSGSLDPSFEVYLGFGLGGFTGFILPDGKVQSGVPLLRYLNDPGLGAGRVDLRVKSTEVSETGPDRQVSFQLHRSQGNRGALVVSWSATGITANPAVDLSAVGGTVRFEDGDVEDKEVTLQVLNDELPEGDEGFSLNINPIYGAALAGAPVLLRIHDDDTMVEFSDTNASLGEDVVEHGLSFVRFGDASKAVSVEVHPKDGSAVLGRDYQILDSVVRFEAGQTNAILRLLTSRDGETEDDEYFSLGLSHPEGGAVIGSNSTVRVQIWDRDGPGSLDPTFRPTDALGPVGSALSPLVGVYDILEQPDGKIVLAGAFQMRATGRIYGVIRLLPDGTLDSAFQASQTVDSAVRDALATQVVLQPDGRLIVVNNGVEAGWQLVRLNVDGSTDAGFQFLPGQSGRRLVTVAHLLPDGKILVGGEFELDREAAPRSVIRLQPDGGLDETFHCLVELRYPDNIDDLYVGRVDVIETDAKGGIYIGGLFNQVGGRPQSHLARLRPDGSLDEGFFSGGTFFNQDQQLPVVRNLVVLPDGGLMVGGSFTNVSGVIRTNLVLLDTAGAVDLSFEASGLARCSPPDFWWIRERVEAISRDDAGRWLVLQQSDETFLCTSLVRLNTDGSLDESFRAAFSWDASYFGTHFNWLRALAIQANGSILVGGIFRDVQDLSFQGWARLNAGARELEFSAVLPQPDGSVRLNLRMPRGQTFQFQRSSELTQWEDVPGVGPISDAGSIVDPAARPQRSRRFYRGLRVR